MDAKPLVPTAVLTEFGEVYDDPSFYQTNGADRDHTYVKGYSDMRRARELAKAAYRRGEIKQSDIPSIPVRLQWVRTLKTNGIPDNTKEVQSGNEGYREVTKADLGQPWFQELPQGAKVVAGGRIQKGDVSLMVCDAPRAARNQAANMAQVKQMTSEAPKGPLYTAGSRVKGADPYVESKLADKPIGAP